MERRFSVEAKAFSFSAKADVSELRLEERRKGFCGFVFLCLQGFAWLMAAIEALKDLVKDFVKYFREDVKALMVRGGGNKAGRYLEVVAFVEGGRKGAIWLPGGREGWGWGWSRILGELLQFLAFLKEKEWPLVSDEPFTVGKQKGDVSFGHSYAAVLRSVDRDVEKFVGFKPVFVTSLDLGVFGSSTTIYSVVEKQKIETLSVTPVELFLTMLANGGEEMQTTLCCYEYELGLLGSLAATSNGIAKKRIETRGSFVVCLVKMLLGLCRFELDWVRGFLGRVSGSGSKPKGFRAKAVNKKPILQLKPVYKSSGNSFKLLLRSS
jgi:hypothetical protein